MWRNIQVCFANKTSLKSNKSLKSIPPSSLEQHASGFFYDHLVTPLKLLSETLNIIYNSNGGLEQPIVFFGITWTAAALIITSLPVCYCSFSSNPCSFLNTPSFMWSKLIFFLLPTKGGKPKDFSYCLISTTPSDSLISNFISPNVDLLKNKEALSLLTC